MTFLFKSTDDAINITDASFSWGNEDEVVLRNISLTVAKGSLAAVVGTVGSGKSSLISSILGETEKLSGSVNTHGTIAYVAQQAWIQNSTLKVSEMIQGREIFDIRIKVQSSETIWVLAHWSIKQRVL